MRAIFGLSGWLAAAAAGVLGSVCLGQDYFEKVQIEQVVGGVAGNTAAQAIQLRFRAPGQNHVSWARLWAYDAQGNNPVLLADLTLDVANGLLGDRVLLATGAMKGLTNPPLKADATMKAIPPAYLAAGRIVYECDCGIMYWSVASGGYAGSNYCAMLNDADGDFGPPFAGAFPSAGVQALAFQGEAQDPSVANSADYALTPGAAVLVNNARQSFTVTSPPAAPSGLAGAEIFKGVVRLTWSDNSNDETGFRIRRQQLVGNVWTNTAVAGQAPADSTAFVEIGSRGVWRYQVQSLNGQAGSDFTGWVRIAPAAPAGLKVQTAQGAVGLAWVDGSAFETRFEVQRAKFNGQWGTPVNVATLGADATSWQDSPGQGTFRYRVRAASEAGSSAFTSWVAVTVP